MIIPTAPRGGKNSAYVDSAIKGIKEYNSDYLIWTYTKGIPSFVKE